MLNVTLAVITSTASDFVRALMRERPHASADYGFKPLAVHVPDASRVPLAFNFGGIGNRLESFIDGVAVYIPGYVNTGPLDLCVKAAQGGLHELV